MLLTDPDRPPARHRTPRRTRRRWNLLLLVPVVALWAPLYNRVEPRLFGVPFLFWFLLALVLLSAVCTALVYRLTKDDYVVTDRPDLLSVDGLDERVADR